MATATCRECGLTVKITSETTTDIDIMSFAETCTWARDKPAFNYEYPFLLSAVSALRDFNPPPSFSPRRDPSGNNR
jgi:hypothetical protein